MENSIRWETEMDTALSKAQTDKKPILLDFHNPG
jgi:hypothetical protein